MEYKGQTHVEHHFHFLKDQLFLDALFVKKPKNIETSCRNVPLYPCQPLLILLMRCPES